MPVTINLYAPPLLRPSFDKAFLEGFEKSYREAWQEGRNQAGPLPDHVETQIRQASAEALVRWSARMLEGVTVDEV